MELPSEIKLQILESILYDIHRALLDTQQSIAFYESDQYKNLVKDSKVYGKQEIEADKHRKQDLQRLLKKLDVKLAFYEKWMADQMPNPLEATQQTS